MKNYYKTLNEIAATYSLDNWTEDNSDSMKAIISNVKENMNNIIKPEYLKILRQWYFKDNLYKLVTGELVATTTIWEFFYEIFPTKLIFNNFLKALNEECIQFLMDHIEEFSVNCVDSYKYTLPSLSWQDLEYCGFQNSTRYRERWDDLWKKFMNPDKNKILSAFNDIVLILREYLHSYILCELAIADEPGVTFKQILNMIDID